MDCVNQSLDKHLIMDVDVLKNKVCCEFDNLLKSLEKGHRYDYQFILEEISLIDLLLEGGFEKSEFVKQFYLNNKWQTKS